MSKLPDPAPALLDSTVVIITENVSTCRHRRHVASREFVTAASSSSEVGSEEAAKRDETLARTNYTFTFGAGSEVLRLLLLLCFNTSHYTWILFFHELNLSFL